MKNLKAALFDLDGTLMDTESQYTVFWGQIARKYRPDVPELEYKIKGMTLVQIYQIYFPDPQVQTEITNALNDWEEKMEYAFLPGAREFIADLRSHGVKCAVVTSSNISKMQSVMKKVSGFADMFDRILTSEDFTASKPAPDCYLLGARVFDCSIEECVVFEDAYNGLKAGMDSGIFTVGITTTIPGDELIHLCHYVIDDYEDLSYERLEEMCESRKIKK